jgi:HSP20 family protein
MFIATARPFVLSQSALFGPTITRRTTGLPTVARSGPGIDLSEDATSYTLRLDTPGVAREHLTIGIEGQIVRIDTVADSPRRHAYAFELPGDIDASTSQARLENGVLAIRLAKHTPVRRPQSIEIN